MPKAECKKYSFCMKIIKYPSPSEYQAILTRPVQDMSVIEQRVIPILEKVKAEGDKALFELALQFDKVTLETLEMDASKVEAAAGLLSEELKTAIHAAYQNIYKFHVAQKQAPEKIETTTGVTCWRKSVGIEKVGVYIPGGTAPLFSTVLMLEFLRK
jgi:histidinol dehydrogenase